MQHPTLTAQKRILLGRKVKQLRKEGKLPANIYGKHIPSQAVQVNALEFSHLYKDVGETGIIDLTIDGKAVPVLVKNPQLNFRTQQPLHVDFYQVNLKEKIKTSVPVRLVGEPTPVVEKQGLLLQLLQEIDIEALPEKLPEAIEVDTTSLQAVGDMLRVADIRFPADVVTLTDSVQLVAQISELVSVEPIEEPTPTVEGEEAPTEGESSEENVQEVPGEENK